MSTVAATSWATGVSGMWVVDTSESSQMEAEHGYYYTATGHLSTSVVETGNLEIR